MDISQYDKIVGAYNVGGNHWALLVSWMLIIKFIFTNVFYIGCACKGARDNFCRSIGWEIEDDKSAKEALEVRL